MAPFIFNNILASFVIFFIFSNPTLSSRLDPSALPRAATRLIPRPRQCVQQMTMIIGYHIPLRLSSEKCEEVP
jgi:hypothetical protein